MQKCKKKKKHNTQCFVTHPNYFIVMFIFSLSGIAKKFSLLCLSRLSRSRTFISKMSHIHVWQFDAACQKEAKLMIDAFILLLVDFSMLPCTSLQHDSWFQQEGWRLRLSIPRSRDISNLFIFLFFIF